MPPPKTSVTRTDLKFGLYFLLKIHSEDIACQISYLYSFSKFLLEPAREAAFQAYAVMFLSFVNGTHLTNHFP